LNDSDRARRLDALGEAKPLGELLTARLAAPDIADGLLAAIDSEGRRHLLIPLAAGDDRLEDAETRGISVVTRELLIPGQGLGVCLDLTCHEPVGHDAFDLVGGDIVGGLLVVGERPARLVARTLAKWRRFWGDLPRSLLSREEQIGLFAELWFLLYWLLPATDPAIATRRWRGSLAARHDFEWQGRSVETKGSTVVRGPVFRVHGLDQLDAPEEGELLLFVLRLREERGAPHTLPRLIAEPRKALEADADAVGLLEVGIARAGYSPIHDAVYSQTTWRVLDERLYPVDGDFPKLSSTSLGHGVPPGVSDISYALDLSGCTGPSFTRPAEAATRLR